MHVQLKLNLVMLFPSINLHSQPYIFEIMQLGQFDTELWTEIIIGNHQRTQSMIGARKVS